jgi:hypothetical protein
MKHTANEGPVRIQYECLVPIYVFPEMKLFARPRYFQNRIIMFCLQFPHHVSVSGFVYSQHRSAEDLSWEYKNCKQIHEFRKCWNEARRFISGNIFFEILVQCTYFYYFFPNEECKVWTGGERIVDCWLSALDFGCRICLSVVGICCWFLSCRLSVVKC